MAQVNRLDHPLYQEDIQRACSYAESNDIFPSLRNKTIAITGATGLIGSFLIDMLIYANDHYDLGAHVYALGRNSEKARQRLPYTHRDDYTFETYDVSAPLCTPQKKADLAIHLASTTHPRAYSQMPIATMTSNFIGTTNLLDYCAHHNADFILASSVEIYGESRKDVTSFDETYCGYLDCNTLRAGYPEAKRASEALCQAYKEERDVSSYIARLPRTFGPTLLQSDTKALSQFLHKGISHEDIILKSEGKQYYSYLYVVDSVIGMLHAYARGSAQEAYNVAHSSGDIHLKDLAQYIATSAGTRVVFDIPDAQEAKGYSTATQALMNGEKLQILGFTPLYSLNEAIDRTLHICRDITD
ncbi:MAG: NAD-dependent epimerase/dehydratase family protein [Actinomycetaceae bacterium]|nr:NAD-dependent epimerase/dehydratase family protein [Actinomycetaceae bacterium]